MMAARLHQYTVRPGHFARETGKNSSGAGQPPITLGNTIQRRPTMEISQVAGATQLLQMTESTVMMKKAAQAQMQVASMVEQLVKQGKQEEGFSVYA
jgi:hypothetical protein